MSLIPLTLRKRRSAKQLGPILKLFDAVGEGKPSPLLHCFYDGTWSTVKRSFTVVHDFKDVCFHSYFSLMDEIRKCPDQNYHEISVHLLHDSDVVRIRSNRSSEMGWTLRL